MRYFTLFVGAAGLLLSVAAMAEHLEELVVTGRHDARTIDIGDEIAIAPDVTGLLKAAPGANVNSNGPLTGIPQYRGMFGARIATSLDGMQLAPSGPNWMDPPLSYAVGGQLESLQVYRGIVPVSVAQESIGGAIDAKSDRGSFRQDSDFALRGRVIASAQSVYAGYHLNTALHAANDRHRFKLAAMTESGDDAEFPDGKIRPSEYRRQRYDIGYGLRHGPHTLQIDYGYNDTGDSGTPALPMDIETIDSDLYRLSYRFDDSGDINLEATVFYSDLNHTMTNFKLRAAPPEGLWRRNTAAGNNAGFELSTTLSDHSGHWNLGVDGFRESHDSDVDNPNSPMFFLVNFNDAERAVLGAFAEREQRLGAHWRTELGLRYNRVEMEAGAVDGSPAMMMPPARELRDAFNSADRSRADNNLDLVARAWLELSANSSLYAGLAQKTRSPSYQERYLWMPMEATAGLADGNVYTGSIDLDPEVSRQLELGLDYSGRALTLSPRIFYHRVRDYIQGMPGTGPAVMTVRMMNRMNDSSTPDPLQFSNVDAEFYGFDMDWRWQLGPHWSLAGVLNYVRGQRDDGSNDDLYRIAPPNTSLRLHYHNSHWSARAEAIAYAEQDHVSAVNREQSSSGYTVFNLLTSWQLDSQLQLSAGVDNLFDRKYRPHLGGYNRAANPDIQRGERLPANGINLFARVLYEF